MPRKFQQEVVQIDVGRITSRSMCLGEREKGDMTKGI